MINISSKDKSILLLITTSIIILWLLTSIFSTIYNKVSFKTSEINKIYVNDPIKWFNVTKPLEAQDLKDKIILLHFWSYSCISCIESIEKIKYFTDRNPNMVAVIGVHSPIFENEKNYNSIKKAIIRYDINYPVINDPNHDLTKKFNITQTPTFLIFNLSGKIYKKYEGTKAIDEAILSLKKLVNKNKYTINRQELPIILEKNFAISSILNNPAKITYVANFKFKKNDFPALIIANSGDNSIVITKLSGEMIFKIGNKNSGFTDGNFSEARFLRPQSVLYDGKNIYVADTGNNAIRLIDIEKQKVSTLIGSGNQGDIIANKKINISEIELSAPTDLEFYPDKDNIMISNSGTNQIVNYNIKDKSVTAFAGNGDNGEDDGIYPANSFSQTQDMTVYDGKLYLVDSKTSSIRLIDKDGSVKTIFSQKINKNSSLPLQNPRGIFVDDSGVFVTDSFNHQIRKFDFNSEKIINIAGSDRGEEIGSKTQLDEPSGIVSFIDKLYVADTNNNRIIIINKANGSSSLLDIIPSQKLPKETFVEYLPNLDKNPEITLKANSEIGIKINVKNGWKINELGPSFINILELKDDNNANLITSFDWNAIMTKTLDFRDLKIGTNYLIQGKIYFCKNSINSLCYIKSYEQKLSINENSDVNQIVIEIGK